MELKRREPMLAVVYEAVLIVLYGIETEFWVDWQFGDQSLNRTLWN